MSVETPTAPSVHAEKFVVMPGGHTRRWPRPKPAWLPGEEVEEATVQRIVRNNRPYPPLTRPTAVEVSRRLTATGESAHEIARRLGISSRTVVRWRKAERQKKEPV